MSLFKMMLISIFLGLSGGLNAADGDLRVAGKVVSDIADGEPPLQVSSTTAVSNLNADMLDGMHASEFKQLGYSYVSIPMGALVLDDAASLDSLGEVNLASAGRSSVRLNWTTPADFSTLSQIYIDLVVFNPTSNGACQASINKSFAINYRPDWPYGSSGRLYYTHQYGTASDFPAYSAGNKIIVHRYWIVNAHAGDTLQFGWVREGDAAEDNCGIVKVVGIKIAYETNRGNDSP